MASVASRHNSLAARLLGRLNLRFPGLFLLLAALTLADLLIPDVIPLVDEIGLGLLTLLLGSWKNRRTSPLDRKGEKT